MRNEIFMNKNDIAYQEIKAMISKGIINNNSSISENSLVAKLNMSRTPIRSALQRLNFEGIIKIVPNQGIIIQEMSIEEVKEKHDLRVAVELYIIKKSINSICEDDINNLREIMHRQFVASSNRDFYAFLKCDTQFHTYFLKYYKNKIMTDIMVDFRERFYPLSLRGLQKRTVGQMAESLKEHQDIVSALEKHDLVATVSLLEKHIQKGILALIQEW